MRTITLNIPTSLEWPERDLKLLMAAKLYEAGALTMSQAASMVNISRRAFTEIIGQFGVSAINHDPSEIDNDFQNAEAYLG
ncbi:MAG: UPF0175 family protein [Bacteroidia bacterium]